MFKTARIAQSMTVCLMIFFVANAQADVDTDATIAQSTTPAVHAPTHGIKAQTYPAQAHTQGLEAEIVKLRTDWAIAKYETPKNKQLPEFERLIQRAQALNQQHPRDPEVLLWHATVLSTYSAIKGGLGVLPYVKKAKTLLEEVIAINGRIENGLAYGILGTLYARVPGWPIAFGNKEKARTNLQMAIQISPQGIDSNYYYGDFLADVAEYEQARHHLEIAMHAPIRKGYEIQDKGRKAEIGVSLAKLH